MRCPRCGSEVASTRLSCPACRQLLHSERLQHLAAAAEAAEKDGNLATAIVSWKAARELLPPESRQHDTVEQQIEALEKRRLVGDPVTGAAAAEAAPTAGAAEVAPAAEGGDGLSRREIRWKKIGLGGGAFGLLLWKLKSIIAFGLTKGKLVLLWLGKSGSLFGALASFGVYWAAWGWKLAAGLMVSLYLHELGHVFSLKRHGIPASAPMFVPGLGAYVRMKKRPPSPAIDARVGLAGPLWGLAAAAVAWLVSQTLDWPSWAAIARFGAWINIFNLIPVWQLDGSRAFNALDRGQRLLLTVLTAVLYLATGEGLLILVGLLAVFRTVATAVPAKGDWQATVTFAALLTLLTLLTGINLIVP